MTQQKVVEYWAQGSSFDLLKESYDNIGTPINPSLLSSDHKFLIEGIGRSFALNEQIEFIEQLEFLGFNGKISLSKPEHTIILIVDYGPLYVPIDTTTDQNPNADINTNDSHSRLKTTKTLKPDIYSHRNMIVGRLISTATTSRSLINKYNLKTRKYLGNTSMEAEMSLVTANMAKVLPGHLVYDPFVGTGSFLLVASEYGAYTFGSDIDGRQIRGTAGFRRNVGGIDANVSSYKLGHLILGNIVSDITKLPFRDSAFPSINAIITDPPYGVRAGAKKLGRKSGNDPVKSLQLVDGGEIPNHLRQDYYPPTCEYEMSNVIVDLLTLAAKVLVVGGRLVFWLPTVTDEYKDSDIPAHPSLTLIANSEQNFGSWSRRLITMEKIAEFIPNNSSNYSATSANPQSSHLDISTSQLIPSNAPSSDPILSNNNLPQNPDNLSTSISQISLNSLSSTSLQIDTKSATSDSPLQQNAEPAHKNFRIKYFNKFE
ncbi:tRNA (guanine(10)-N2)-methyltransferase [Smittium culicis]|uniref:tRNA (guanine(10)-N(2))-methyltransferase n=1 Tax=Smittium culicis TaxID=133412 RepID=A0A1R1X885_9FUNG|nr:tRNA (guanine(10)-N2)-methyltransferase [Smittium culicis]